MDRKPKKKGSKKVSKKKPSSGYIKAKEALKKLRKFRP